VLTRRDTSEGIEMALKDSTTRRNGAPTDPSVGSWWTWARFLGGFGALYAVLMGTSAIDATGRWGLGILAAVLLTAAVVERVLYRSSLTGMARRLGLGRPGGRALVVAAAVCGRAARSGRPWRGRCR